MLKQEVFKGIEEINKYTDNLKRLSVEQINYMLNFTPKEHSVVTVTHVDGDLRLIEIQDGKTEIRLHP